MRFFHGGVRGWMAENEREKTRIRLQRSNQGLHTKYPYDRFNFQGPNGFLVHLHCCGRDGHDVCCGFLHEHVWWPRHSCHRHNSLSAQLAAIDYLSSLSLIRRGKMHSYMKPENDYAMWSEGHRKNQRIEIVAFCGWHLKQKQQTRPKSLLCPHFCHSIFIFREIFVFTFIVKAGVWVKIYSPWKKKTQLLLFTLQCSWL